jgi:NADH-quinone oxidoreductase subunit C
MPELSTTAAREQFARDLPQILVSAEPLHLAPPPSHGPVPGAFVSTELHVAPEHLVTAALYLRDTLGYTYLSDLAVVDYLHADLFELVYRFYQVAGGTALVLKVRIPRDEPHVPSLTPEWPGANFHEREAFDLFGVHFTDHPFLQRIYMWDEFEGFPMRKDFPKQGDKYIGEGE